LALQLLSGERVERRERLVHEQDLRLNRERAGDAHALLHPARELVGEGVGGVAQAGGVQQAVDDRRPRAAPLDVEPVGDVLAHGLPGEQPEVLEDHRDARRGAGDRLGVQPDLALSRREQPAHGAQQRRLAAAGRADDAHQLVLADLQVDVLGDDLVAERHRDLVQGDLRGRHG
jgi:hypothetical protein